MYAVVRTGGKQYHVSPGEVIHVEKLEGEPGDAVELGEVLLAADGDKVVVGQPLIQGASVQAEIVDQGRNPKVIIYKFRRRKRYRRKNGHRQPFTRLKVTGIQGIIGGSSSGMTASAPAEA